METKIKKKKTKTKKENAKGHAYLGRRKGRRFTVERSLWRASRPGSRSNDFVSRCVRGCRAGARRRATKRSILAEEPEDARAQAEVAAHTASVHSRKFRAPHDIRRKHRLLTYLLLRRGPRVAQRGAGKTRGGGSGGGPETSLFLTSPASLLIKTHWPTLTVMLARKCSFPV